MSKASYFFFIFGLSWGFLTGLYDNTPKCVVIRLAIILKLTLEPFASWVRLFLMQTIVADRTTILYIAWSLHALIFLGRVITSFKIRKFSQNFKFTECLMKSCLTYVYYRTHFTFRKFNFMQDHYFCPFWKVRQNLTKKLH